MSDRLFFGLIAAAAVLMIAVALVWPQGLGARSPGPFGHAVAAAGPEAPKIPKLPKFDKHKAPL